MTGLILVDKPSGISSFGAVSAIRNIYSEKRAGHTGTLDPLATGVLPVLLGRATRLSGFVMERDKSYTAGIRLGLTTDTLDITGTVTDECAVSVSDEELRCAVESFLGEYMQLPPMYSALKVGGKKLYELARKGVETERAARPVRIEAARILSRSGNDFTLEVRCSKGTYIRSLADDIGKKLGCGAVMTSLRRTETAGFDIADCHTLEQLRESPEEGLLPAWRAVPQFKRVYVTEGQALRFTNGGELSLGRLTLPEGEDSLLAVFTEKEFLGLGELKPETAALGVKCVIAERRG